ncbi:hypothetical protein ACJJTC_011415 [Scirpophaga incertulas]
MFGRPRCREWTPLATQQLRLRSLIQIVGYNIRPPEGCMAHCSFYLTLHHTTMSAPFYTSERISSPHPKWKEIDSEIIQGMSSTNVVIRIWCHILQLSSQSNEPIQDFVIQTWGVYFTGLRYIGANIALNFTSDCFKSNTLVFQMHGGYFCSYKSLKLDIIPPENEMEHGSMSSDSSGRTNLSRINLDTKFIQSHRFIKESRSISPSKFSKKSDREYSKSNSPVERGFHHNYPTLKTSASLNIAANQRDYRRKGETNERHKVDPNYIYEHSPDSMDVIQDVNGSLSKNTSHENLADSKIDLSETAENYDLRNESFPVPKYRYIALNFLKSEIRPSYTSSKLQKLHLLQYSIKKRQESVQEIKERIYQKSALTNDNWPQPGDVDFRLKFKNKSPKCLFSPDNDDVDKQKASLQCNVGIKNGRIKEDKKPPSNGPRLALKLNDLLSLKSKPSPFQRAEHVRLTKQLEILRFKKIILSDERDSKRASIRKLKEVKAKLYEENQDLGSELMESYHNLSRRGECVKEKRQACAAVRELAARAHASLSNLRCDLLTSLHQIFHIEQKNETTWTIVSVPLPMCEDEAPRATNPVTDSVAAGFAAQATCLAAAILNQPLRYKISLLGSASKILDITPDLPDPNIPLFARGGDATLFLYAMFLLNKCIGQLLRGRGLPVTDMRTTLANLQRLLLTPCTTTHPSKTQGASKSAAEICPKTQSLRSLVATDRCRYRQFNRFKDSVDGQSPQSAMNLRRHRHSRSVGSYQDDQEIKSLDASTSSVMGSEPNIYNTKLPPVDTEIQDSQLITHSSDTEIQRADEVESDALIKKVVFTLGDDTTLVDVHRGCNEDTVDSNVLVRISCNNGDTEVGENMKRICSQIEDFCMSTEKDNIAEGSHVGVASNNVDESADNTVGSCESCDYKNACELICAKTVSDVIVIPSDEAIVDSSRPPEESSS